MAKSGTQLSLALSAPPRWGGRRVRAGRKSKGDRAGLSHARRAQLSARCPVHVTLRMRSGVPSLRSPRLVREFARSLSGASERGSFRVVHYSLQSNHVHLMVEADDRSALAHGMISVGSRLARAVNRVFGRTGPVLSDRYHARSLTMPREVRNALRYVLLNVRHHVSRWSNEVRLDPASSARWFDGWSRRLPGKPEVETGSRTPVARARTWLLSVGWRRYGLLDPGDVPGAGRASSPRRRGSACRRSGDGRDLQR